VFERVFETVPVMVTVMVIVLEKEVDTVEEIVCDRLLETVEEIVCDRLLETEVDNEFETEAEPLIVGEMV